MIRSFAVLVLLFSLPAGANSISGRWVTPPKGKRAVQGTAQGADRLLESVQTDNVEVPSPSDPGAATAPNPVSPANPPTVGSRINSALSNQGPRVSYTSTANPAPPGHIEFDDNQPKNKTNPGPPPRANTAADPTMNGGGGGGSRAKAEAFDRWWPMCVFADPGAGDANAILKGLVDMAAECRVNLVVFPFYIKSNYPSDPAALNAAAKNKCNATEGFQAFGANRGSVATLVSRPGIANEMCGCHPGGGEMDACGEFGYPPGDGIQARLENTCRFGGVAKSGEVAASIIGPGSFDAASVAAVAQGQSQLGLPPGAGAGNGTGDIDEGYASAGSLPEKGWKQKGCEQMRANSFANNGKWKYNKDQQNYLKLPQNSDRLFDLMGSKQIFHSKASAPAGGNSPATPSGGGGASREISSVGSDPGLSPAASGGDPEPDRSEDKPPPGHKKPVPGRGAGRAARSGAIYGDSNSGGGDSYGGEGGGEGDAEGPAVAIGVPPASSGGSSRPSGTPRPTVGFDDSAPRGGQDRWSSSPDTNPPAGGSGNGASSLLGGAKNASALNQNSGSLDPGFFNSSPPTKKTQGGQRRRSADSSAEVSGSARGNSVYGEGSEVYRRVSDTDTPP